ncbi:single-stranded DNA-binding protein [Evansella cellulosilytica]|uniref:Single-stranded DNA-binding protein n=1 Tax=Evansella cellulosilytica (strain ATCC 21833 / DSM 2522 / FERM P-1141 / JCM 9156 / N-4) TaxID=649639 RepID=E6TS66_EVAC2|nr:single-stranded DNA-binding protein [Evansella cellulosilytica]ADU31835.1 single-strand binding protein [Evansella cellulosilytica DSM 2522]
MLNQVMLIGRISKDPVMNTTKEGTAVTRLHLAVRRNYKNAEGNYDTDFISCTAWKKLAETTSDYCSKGSLVCVTGRIQMRSYDIGDNRRMTVSEIVAENVTFLQLKRNQTTTSQVNATNGASSQYGSNHIQQVPIPTGNGTSNNREIPFDMDTPPQSNATAPPSTHEESANNHTIESIASPSVPPPDSQQLNGQATTTNDLPF